MPGIVGEKVREHPPQVGGVRELLTRQVLAPWRSGYGLSAPQYPSGCGDGVPQVVR